MCFLCVCEHYLLFIIQFRYRKFFNVIKLKRKKWKRTHASKWIKLSGLIWFFIHFIYLTLSQCSMVIISLVIFLLKKRTIYTRVHFFSFPNFIIVILKMCPSYTNSSVGYIYLGTYTPNYITKLFHIRINIDKIRGHFINLMQR